jgi:hypothetical protein
VATSSADTPPSSVSSHAATGISAMFCLTCKKRLLSSATSSTHGAIGGDQAYCNGRCEKSSQGPSLPPEFEPGPSLPPEFEQVPSLPLQLPMWVSLLLYYIILYYVILYYIILLLTPMQTLTLCGSGSDGGSIDRSPCCRRARYPCSSPSPHISQNPRTLP